MRILWHRMLFPNTEIYGRSFFFVDFFHPLFFVHQKVATKLRPWFFSLRTQREQVLYGGRYCIVVLYRPVAVIQERLKFKVIDSLFLFDNFENFESFESPPRVLQTPSFHEWIKSEQSPFQFFFAFLKLGWKKIDLKSFFLNFLTLASLF